MSIRNAFILLALLVWFVAVVTFALCRQWSFVVPLPSLGGAFEAIAHNALKE